ncbi:MAG: hypothetical protein IPM82_11885 [Saprospiraceae bacterium]|nr:hypothetical protein [Saprospiraceae bacterium]
MKKHLLTLLSLSFAAISLCQQIPFSGVVTIMNSGYDSKTGKIEYVSLATVEDDDKRAQSTLTLANGSFKLVLVGLPQNEHFTFQVKKEGLEVVNIDELEAVAGQKEQAKIFMAKPQYIADFRSNIYKVGKTNAQIALDKKQAQLLADYNAEKNKSQLNQERIGQLETALAKVFTEKTQIEAVANELADKYKRINLDDASELFQEAFRWFQEGDLPKAQKLLQHSLSRADSILIGRKRNADLKRRL